MNFLRLIKKDLRLERRFILPLIGIQAAGIAIFRVQMPSGLPGLLCALTLGVALVGDFLVCYRTMLAEEKNRAMLFLRTLPVSTREIVAAKFAVNLLLVTVNLGMLLGLYTLARATGHVGQEPALSAATCAAALLAHCSVNAFFVAISMAFHSEKAVWVTFPALFLVMTLILNFNKIVAALRLENAVQWIAANPAAWLFVLLLFPFALFQMTVFFVSRKRLFS